MNEFEYKFHSIRTKKTGEYTELNDNKLLMIE